MRNKFIAGNWKMNTSRAETVQLVRGLIERTADIEKTTIMIAPPFTNLDIASDLLQNSSIKLGAQNVYWEEKGAFTGEISPFMLKDLNCSYVIIGHSERRQYFGETDQDVNRKVNAVLKHGLLPVVCVGETLEQRQSGQAQATVESQVRNSLQGFSSAQADMFTIAYEPRWAIGTGRAATPDDAVEMHSVIRALLREMLGKETAETIRIQYGGSVTAENIASFMQNPQIDGALVGGASLKVDSFAKIIEITESVTAF